MDLAYGPEYEAFRQEVRDFIARHRDAAPKGVGAADLFIVAADDGGLYLVAGADEAVFARMLDAVADEARLQGWAA